MKNVQKFFDQTCKGVEGFKQRTQYLQDDAEEKQEKKELGSKVAEKAFLKALSTVQLAINQKRGIVMFERIGMEDYIQPIYVKRRRRINVIPLCFMVELYKAGISEIPEAKSCEIPFTLRGFWKMDKAISCINSLITIRNLQARNVKMLLNMYSNAEIVDALDELLDAIEALNVSNLENGCMLVNYKDMSFKANMANVKVDVVPLCKMICKYYTDIANAIMECESKMNSEADKDRIRRIEESFEAFVEKYFIPRMRLM